MRLIWHKSIKEIPKREWEKLCHSSKNPFYDWEWLNTLETSNSININTGWQPLFLSAWRSNSLIAVAPLYLKNHSFGEFVFDNLFSELAINLGVPYYPKIVGMSPASPIQGYRFFFADKENEIDLTALMIKTIDQFAIENGILSCNFLYVDPNWQQSAELANCSKWTNIKSLWSSGTDKTFLDYLNRFNSNQRRNIKRERKFIRDKGIQISNKIGKEIETKDMQLMHSFYKGHCDRWGAWGSKYLSEKFFQELAKKQNNEQVILFYAYLQNSDDPIAMSLCIKNEQYLWGRYWGCKEEIDYLHFELCYYSPIEWALQNKIKFFDPGAGGSHKRRRGFLAVPNISLHRWYNKEINYLIKQWLPKANELIMNEIKATNNEVPFKSKQLKISIME